MFYQFYQSVNTINFLIKCVFVFQDPSSVHAETENGHAIDDIPIDESIKRSEAWMALHEDVENKTKVEDITKRLFFCKICGYRVVQRSNLLLHLEGRKQKRGSNLLLHLEGRKQKRGELLSGQDKIQWDNSKHAVSDRSTMSFYSNGTNSSINKIQK